MKLSPVQSSQINAIGYAAATNTMRIEFKSGGLYEYANVTPEVFEAFSTAKSIGSHFYKHIKPFADKYPYVKLEANKAIDAPQPEPTTTTESTDELVGDARGVMADVKEADQERLEETQPVEEHEQPGGGGL